MDGKDVYTHFQPPIQSFKETQMDAFQEKVKGKYMTATLVSAKTCEIFANTQRPTFNADYKEGITKDCLVCDILSKYNYARVAAKGYDALAASIDNNTFPGGEYFNQW